MCKSCYPTTETFYSRILLKKSGHPTPRVELDEIGPSLDLVLRRTHLASSDLYKEACKVPKAAKVSIMPSAGFDAHFYTCVSYTKSKIKKGSRDQKSKEISS